MLVPLATIFIALAAVATANVGDLCEGSCEKPMFSFSKESWCPPTAECRVQADGSCRAVILAARDCNDSNPSTYDYCDSGRCVNSQCPPFVPVSKCLVSPCSVSKCDWYPTAVCHNDYCGGCNARWTLSDGFPVNCSQDPCEVRKLKCRAENRCVLGQCVYVGRTSAWVRQVPAGTRVYNATGSIRSSRDGVLIYANLCDGCSTPAWYALLVQNAGSSAALEIRGDRPLKYSTPATAKQNLPTAASIVPMPVQLASSSAGSGVNNMNVSMYSTPLFQGDVVRVGPYGETVTIREPSRMLYVDYMPTYRFVHSTGVLILGRHAHYLETNWYPSVNGKVVEWPQTPAPAPFPVVFTN
eukprot:m51a1_g4035 hypothetical protein (355) ;mRNA; r:661808-662924